MMIGSLKVRTDVVLSITKQAPGYSIFQSIIPIVGLHIVFFIYWHCYDNYYESIMFIIVSSLFEASFIVCYSPFR